MFNRAYCSYTHTREKLRYLRIYTLNHFFHNRTKFFFCSFPFPFPFFFIFLVCGIIIISRVWLVLYISGSKQTKKKAKKKIQYILKFFSFLYYYYSVLFLSIFSIYSTLFLFYLKVYLFSHFYFFFSLTFFI